MDSHLLIHRVTDHLANFEIQGGFVEVLNNKVIVLVEGVREIE